MTIVYGRPLRRRTAVAVAAVVAAAAVGLTWSAGQLDLSIGELVRGLPWIGGFLRRMWPPHWGFAAGLVRPVLETVQLALWGTLLSLLLAMPLCMFGARNVSPHPALFHLTRQFFNALRGINEVIFALLFVSAVGLGPFAGVLALSVHGAGMLGRFFSDALEDADPGPIEALRATGAHPLQVLVFGLLPQVFPTWIAATLYRLEVNLRAATILGMVGAGGIGFELYGSLKLFQYQDTVVCVIVILAMVMATDFMSTRLRARILER